MSARVLKPMFRVIGRILVPIARAFNRFIVLPIYSITLMAKIRLEKTIVSARGFVFFVFTNRYVSHVLLFVIALGTVGSQLMTQTASAQDAGQNSLLYTLVTHGQDDSVEESIAPGLALADTHYVGSDTIQTVPGIDYDYESTSDVPVDLGISGNIAIVPQSDFPAVTPDDVGANEDTLPDDTTPTTPVAPRQGTQTYTVKSGDTIASIARSFGLNVGTIQWANNLTSRSTIRPGDTLRIPAASGVLYTVKSGDTVERLASAYHVDATSITKANNLRVNSRLSVGTELLIPDATPIAVVTPPKTTGTKPSTPTINGVAVKTNIPITPIKGKSVDIYQETAKEGSDVRIKPPDIVVNTGTTQSRLLWPTHLHVINQYYGYQHTGVDIDGDYTDPWYAAADGVVEVAGWNNGGYGLMVLIDHGNGIKTRYGHASKLFVKAGDTVKRGEVIGMVGTTGRSTGTHLHFEVYVNGRRTNPLTYIR
jgi:murein DD-endopeptidase MepM/ murein hydrolase activator NlpD